eukprot:jgi/Botrbrau1/7285/Bobra.0318s0021.1
MDFPRADLLIVMGTSLVVQPFASFINMVSPETPRLLINREKVGMAVPVNPLMAFLGIPGKRGFNFDMGNYRDALFLGDCDDGVRKLCELLGWDSDLRDLQNSGGMSAMSSSSGSSTGAV